MACIGEMIKDLRIKNDLSQSDLALSLGIKRHTISAYETGSITPPIDKLILISKYFGVSIDYLCGLSNNENDLVFDAYCVSKLQKIKSENDLELLTCLIKYGDKELYKKAKTYLNKKYDDNTKEKIDEYILVESIKETLNKYKKTTK